MKDQDQVLSGFFFNFNSTNFIINILGHPVPQLPQLLSRLFILDMKEGTFSLIRIDLDLESLFCHQSIVHSSYYECNTKTHVKSYLK